MTRSSSASVACLLVLTLLAPSAGAVARQPSRARSAMVATTSVDASRVGVDVLRRGGNAVDAAVAVALALAVTWPTAGNLGGGGFMVIRRADGRAEVIDFRERAPRAATAGMYLDAQGNVVPGASTVGLRAVGIPGTVAGLALARERHGKLAWRDLVEPARKLAADGFVADWALHRSLRERENVERLSTFPESRRIFLGDGKPVAEFETFRQPDLARTLTRLRDQGPREFYEGETAQRIVDAMTAGGGLITAEDLRTYEPTLREPLRGTYRGFEILTMPPPSSGGIALVAVLNMLEGHDVGALGAGSTAERHLLAETMRRAFADRSTYLGDTDFVSGVPVQTLASKAYARQLGATFDPARATPSADVLKLRPVIPEGQHTTHFAIVDAEGSLVTCTYTLNENYGSGVTVPGTGILLNNEMDDFTAKPGVPNAYGLVQGDRNAIAPGKRPLSSMTPTIVLKDGKPWMALGSPGGPTIITVVLQVVVNVIDHHMGLQEAVDAPRIHHQWLPDLLEAEPGGLNPDVRARLAAMGHAIGPRDVLGDVHAVMIEDGLRLGAADPRSGGAAIGY